jgi:hypothetical protein
VSNYYRTSLGGFTPEQIKALTAIEPASIRELPVDRRVELALLHSENEARKKEAFWNAVQAFATGALPILAFFGITRWGK